MATKCGDEWTDGEMTLPISINFMNILCKCRKYLIFVWSSFKILL